MTSRFWPVFFSAFALVCALYGEPPPKPFDAAPFGTPIEDGHGIMWDDPREIHAVTVDFADTISDGAKIHVEYWGSHWPAQHLPKDREPGGGDVGWLELGNWYNGGWRVADTEQAISGNSVHFTFRPVNAKEFPQLTNYTICSL